MSLRGLAIGVVIGAGVAAAPLLFYRQPPSHPPVPTVPRQPATPSAPPVEQRQQAVRSQLADTTAPATHTDPPQRPRAQGGSPTLRILRNLANHQADGFPPPRQGLLSQLDLERVLARAGDLVEAGQLEAAHELLSETYFRFELTQEQRTQLEQVLEPLAEQLLRSTDPPYYGVVHVVQPGDTPARIARPFKIPHQYLARLNGFGRYIRVGQRLKIVKGPFDVLVELGNFELVVLLRGRFVKRYPIGIGKDGSSPTGLFRVMQKVVNPTWYPAEGGVIPPDDPRNPLGTRWIGIGGSYGIHGTREPESIGRAESRGCIRMYNQDVEELYDMLVEEHSRVLIRP